MRTLTGTNANFFALTPAPMLRNRSAPVQKLVTSGNSTPVLCSSSQHQSQVKQRALLEAVITLTLDTQVNQDDHLLSDGELAVYSNQAPGMADSVDTTAADKAQGTWIATAAAQSLSDSQSVRGTESSVKM